MRSGPQGEDSRCAKSPIIEPRIFSGRCVANVLWSVPRGAMLANQGCPPMAEYVSEGSASRSFLVVPRSSPPERGFFSDERHLLQLPIDI